VNCKPTTIVATVSYMKSSGHSVSRSPLTSVFFSLVFVQLLISVLPGICSDLLRAYHNDWLGDVILIIFFTLR
jgi:hypothetical protein